MQPFKILVVEDFEEFRRFVSSLLQPRAEFQVKQASDGLEAVQKAEAIQPDLIILDISLPNLNGIEVARRVHKLAPSTKILFLSVESDADLVNEALSLGAGYIHKPRASRDLLPAIETVLKGERFVSKGLEFGADENTKAHHRHEILLCHDDAAILESLTHFVATALNAGNAAIVLATDSHRDSLLKKLRAQGVQIDAAIQQGTYISLDASKPTDPVEFLEAIRGLRDAAEAAAMTGNKHPRVAFCGERAGRLWAEGKTEEAIQLEQLCDDLAKEHEVDILCVYPLLKGQDAVPALDSIFAQHSAASYR
ncbi:MAG TPA: response regulator [Candidatus Acidoferrum sp.]|nr:response regulator [Candidatus Acidoferrum sp.]